MTNKIKMGFICCDCCKKIRGKNKKIDNIEHIEIELEDKKDNQMKLIVYKNKCNITSTPIYESKIGFINAGGSCYMASIIQILIHLKSFIEIFKKKKKAKKNYLSNILNNLIDKINNAQNSIEISEFSEEYNKINHKFRGDTGNNPMTFFLEFVKQLDLENKDILKLFNGKKIIQFHGMDDMNYEEDFIFYMITIDKNYRSVEEAMNKETEMEDDANIKISEKITLKPEIFIINLEVDNIDYNFEEKIKIDKTIYLLKAINEYNTIHSTV